MTDATSNHRLKQTNSISTDRMLQLPWLLLLWSTSCHQLVAGQKSTAITTHLTRPDLSNPNTAIVLVVFLILWPIYITGFILIWRRRKHFPIAGRGSKFLIFWSGLNVVHCLSCSTVAFLWPLGMPCGMEFFLHWCFTIPTCTIYMLRGWTLVFRLEIMNYLTETRWRQEKKKMMETYTEQQKLEPNEENESRSSILDVKPEAGVTKIVVQPTPDKAAMDEDPTTIPGYFFIHHRGWIESKFLFPIVGGFAVVVILAMVLVATFDPDIQLTNENFHREGVLPDGVDYTKSQFLPDTWLSSPVCLSYGIKFLLYLFIIGTALMPFLGWCAWRIYLDKKHQAERKKDQIACYKLVHGKEPDSDATDKVAGGLKLDDSQNVKDEFHTIIMIAGKMSAVYFPVQMFVPGYTVFVLLSVYLFLFCNSIAKPLYLSFAVSRKHREMIDRSKIACDANSVKKAAGDKDGTYNRLPHQRPYFTLKYILHQSHTYDVLLAFLQKEYSSENALFWSEARAFEKAAKELEAKIPTWPSSMDPDEEQTTHGGSSGGPGGSILGSAARVGTVAERTLLRKSTNGISTQLLQRMTSLPSPVKVSLLTQHTSMDTQLSPNNQRQNSTDLDLPDLPLASMKSGSIEAGGQSPTVATLTTAASLLSPTHIIYISPPLSPGLTLPVSPSSPDVIFPPLSPTAAKPAASSPKNACSASSANGVSSTSGHSQGMQITFSPTSSPSTQGSAIQLVNAPLIDFAALHSDAIRLKKWAEKMNDDYLKRSAILEINIPEDLSKLVQSQVAQLSTWSLTPLTEVTDESEYSSYPLPPPFPLSTLYRATQIAVFDLIQRDSFRRFILTPGFQQLLHQADEDELARLEKQQDLMLDTAEVVDKAMQALSGNTPNQTINGIPSQQRHSNGGPTSNLVAGGGSVVGNGGASRFRRDEAAVDGPEPALVEEEDEPVYNLPGTPSRANHYKPKNVRLPSTSTHVIEEDSPIVAPLNRSRGTTPSGSPTLIPASTTLAGMAMNADARGSISLIEQDPIPSPNLL